MNIEQLTIVIPALNEKNRIMDTIKEYHEYFGKRAIIHIVDNGSSDGTYEAVQEAYADNEFIEIERYDYALGKGGAVYAGFDKAHTEVIGFTDADGATPAKEFDHLVQAIGDVDVAIGSRWIKGATMVKKQSGFRQRSGRMFNGLVNLLFNLDIYDTQCGAKVMKKEVYDRIKGVLYLRNYSFDVELLVMAREFGYTIKEIPIQWTNKYEAQFDPVKSGLQAVKDVLRLRFRMYAYSDIEGKKY